MLSEIDLYPDHVRKSYRRGRWKLIVKFEAEIASEAELYDKSEDPNEQDNLASEHPDVVAQLERELTLRVQEATALSASFDQSPDLDLSERENEQLRALGYIE